MPKEKIINDEGLDVLFRTARTHTKWQNRDVSETLIKAVYDLAKMGPTSANCSPARFVIVKSKEAKEKLKPTLDAGNVEKTMAAPATVIIAQDMEFYQLMPKLFPHTDAKSWFVGKDEYIKSTAFRNSSLQGAYFMLAARSLGLDCGPMSGFNAEKLNEAFFKGTNYKVNFICNIGYGDETALHPRSPRLTFEEACKIE